jgi:nitronate monooxygenase
MGAGVSHWQLANTVARRGQLGVISGTALDQILARRLQQGDPDGAMRRAIAAFPHRDIAQRALDQFFVPGGKPAEEPFRYAPMFRVEPTRDMAGLAVLAAFCETWLAREGHDGPVGINLLEKIQLPILTTLYGAMMAGVDYVLVGAGIPWQVPGNLDDFAQHRASSMKVAVEDEQPGMSAESTFDPAMLGPVPAEPLKRPNFLAIVSSATLAQALLKRATGSIEGFVVEGSTAGGHNAPPRGKTQFNQRGEPIYGERDLPQYDKFRELKLPFWIAGGVGNPEGLKQALEDGAQGIQVGTAFGFCRESGLCAELREAVLQDVRDNRIDVFTDALASPTGFPFKVVRRDGSLTDESIYAQRERVCDLGYLRRVYRKPDGELGYRCAAQPEGSYIQAGGKAEDLEKRACLCNALLANIGMPQTRKGQFEPPLLTAGDELENLRLYMPEDSNDYSANDVIDKLLAGV